MKKFITNILIFALIFFIVEKAFYFFMFISPTLEIDNRLEKVINGEMNKDIIVLGSSRGARNIIAGQIEDSLTISAYNLSYVGSDIQFHEFLLRSLIKFNKPPKIVLLAVDNFYELLPNESMIFRLDVLYPLAKYNYINDEMIKRGEKNYLSNFLILSRINKSNFDLRKKHFSSLDTIIACGSMPIFFQRKDREFKSTNYGDYNVAKELSVKVKSYIRFQKLCTINNIKLLMVFSPNFNSHFNLEFEKRLKDLAEPDVAFYVYDSLNTVYQDKSFFYDEVHLKTNGAVIFTNEIINKLRSLKQTKQEHSIE